MMKDYTVRPKPKWLVIKRIRHKIQNLLKLKLHFSNKRGKIAPYFDQYFVLQDELLEIKRMKRIVSQVLSMLLFLGTAKVSAQQFAQVTIHVTASGKAVEGVIVKMKTGILEETVNTNSDGNAFFTTLTPGEYDIDIQKSGFLPQILNRTLSAGLNSIEEVSLAVDDGSGTSGPVVISVKAKKVIEMDEGSKSVSGSAALKGGGRGTSALSRTNAAINDAGGGTSVRGSRTDGNGTYIDGMRIIGGGAVPSLGVESISVNVGGIPAMFGDLTGGAFSYISKGATLKLVGAVEGITSTGLDPFGFNTVEGFVSGPLWKKSYLDSAKKRREYVKIGFTLNGNLGYYKDPNPTRTGVYVVKEQTLENIKNNPLRITPQGFVSNASYLTLDSLDHLKARPNSALYEGNFIGKLEFKPSPLSQVTAYGSYFYNTGRSVSNAIMTFEDNARNDNTTYRTYLLYTQKFKVDPKSTMKDAFYSVRAEYQNSTGKSRDAVHMNDVFNYGHIGTFQRYLTERYAYDNYDNVQNPNRAPKVVTDQFGRQVTLTNAYYQEGFMDTAYSFTPDPNNAVRAKYTQNVFDFYKQRGFRVTSPFQVQVNQGLLNGFNPASVYSIWGTPGQIQAGFGKSQTERYSLFAIGQMKVQGRTGLNGLQKAPHDLQAGLYYEQQISRSYSLNANGLWVLMGQLANSHISELDKSVAYLNYDANGVFGDTVRYQRLINASEQSSFDKNLRNALIASGAKDVNGNAYNERTFIDVNSLDPNTFKMDYFSADELLNSGNNYVSYFGYDHLGNKVSGKPSIDAFLQDPAKRTIGAFQPVYIAAWLQDQIQFKNLVFRGGLRMERYDANQLVMKDAYSLFPIKTAAEVSKINGLDVKHPSNIGKDFAVYVNNINNPTKIVGYRNENTWYNADGSVQKSPEFLANQTNNGKIAPYLVDPKQEDITSNTFEDFTPVINILPRIWFSFPLEANKKTFYVSYDVLAQRPNSGASFLSIDEVYYLKNRQGATISNGSLQPRLKTDYEIGYKEIFGEKRNKAIELAASYSEIRQDFGLYQVSNAYPVTYVTFRNIDFSTVTGFRAGVTMNNIGKSPFGKLSPLSVLVSYMLQFADGTGSNINSQQALIQSNQPNLRNIVPLGDLDVRHTLKAQAVLDFLGGRDANGKETYCGPVGLKKYLEYASIALIGNTYSGLPYTPTTIPVQIGAVQRAPIKGDIFGARMDWQNTFDINITKGFLINRKTKDNPLVASVFLWVQNVLNTKNVVNVFPYTGAPLDDGFLNSPNGQQVINSQISSQSYVDLYRTLLNSNTGNYGRPRNTRIGVRFNFN